MIIERIIKQGTSFRRQVVAFVSRKLWKNASQSVALTRAVEEGGATYRANVRFECRLDITFYIAIGHDSYTVEYYLRTIADNHVARDYISRYISGLSYSRPYNNELLNKPLILTYEQLIFKRFTTL